MLANKFVNIKSIQTRALIIYVPSTPRILQEGRQRRRFGRVLGLSSAHIHSKTHKHDRAGSGYNLLTSSLYFSYLEQLYIPTSTSGSFAFK